MPSSSSVSRQSAEKPGAAIAMRLTPLRRIGGEHRVGRRLEPFRAAEARLEGDVDLAAQRLAEQPRGLLAVAVIGIAELQRPLRHAVEAQQQPLGLEIERGELPLEVRLAAPRCRADRRNKAAACAAPAASASRASAANTASFAVAVVAAQYCG